jgi:hypothetical protein
MSSNISRWIQDLADDPEKNIHGLKARTIASRVYKDNWTVEQALTTPLMNHTEAARRAAKVSPWGKWEPGKFSRSDKSRRKDIPSWDDSLSS